MTRFRFEALNADGIPLMGAVEANTDREAARVLERRGLTVVAVQREEAETPKTASNPKRRTLRQSDLLLALHEVAVMLQAGVALVEAMEAQARSVPQPRLREAFGGIAQALRRGQSFSAALTAVGLPLPIYALTLVRAGETSGLLARAIADAVDQMAYDEAIKGEVRQALTYPSVLVAAGLAAIVLMFTFVVPKFASLLERADELPLLAAWVLGTGMFLRDHVLTVGLTTTSCVILAIAWIRKPAQQVRIGQWLESLPLIGPWRIEAETARWAKVLATLLGNRVPLMDALELARSGVRSAERRLRLGEASKAVRGGTPLADALEQQETLTATGYNLIRVGERAGQLPAMLQSLASLCQDAGRARMKQLLTLLEPIAILTIGGVIGLIMIGIILGITSVNDVVI